jgi:predicted alpha-1,2-mannosidase
MKTYAAVLSLLLCSGLCVSARQSPTAYVDPFVGTGGHGHTFPGATVPFGMVQLSPDTRLTGWDGCSGYHYSDDIVYGFSHTHLSGTGISDYGDVLLMPTAGDVRLDALGARGAADGYASRFSHRDERAAAGFYSVRLDDDDILAELTAMPRVGFHRYTFRPTADANVILDLTHRDKVLDSGLRVTADNRVEGFRRSEAWAKDQLVYFVAEFSRPFTSHAVAVGGRAEAGRSEARGTNVKASFTFDARGGAPVMVKVAISAVSAEGAAKNLAAELKHWDFDRARSDAERAWSRALGKIEVSGGTREQLVNFYTALYHSMLAPNLFMDVDGRYRGRDLKTHTAEGFDNYTVFSLWDTFRAAHPLYTIVERKRTADFINTFLAQYEHGGRLPVWELAGNETDTMIGYHAASVIADAAAKGVKGFDLEKAFAAMKHSARLKHFGLDAYARRGYISSEDEPESVSKTLEYAYDDWCVAVVAKLLGRREDYEYFIRRAQNYKNLFDPDTGFMRARRNGGWVTPFDPREVNFSFTEANSWQYSFFAPHDIGGLVELSGGGSKFARRLDGLFAAEPRTTGREQADITGLIGQYAHGNEPSHHVAYLYNFAGRPWKTQARVRQIMDTFYAPRPDGLIGNEDCGQMSAWYVLSAAGLYQVAPGRPLYSIGTPLFGEVRFNLENGKAFVVKARGVSSKNIYIQSARLNGRPYAESYLTHADIMGGGEIVYRMGPTPNKAWGAGDAQLRAATIDHELITPVPVIQSDGDSFRHRMTVTLKPTARGLKLYYTTDGSDPDTGSALYARPLVLRRPTTVKAVAVDGRGARSLVTTARFRRILHDWKIRVLSEYAPQYSAGGPDALIDGARGGPDFRTGAWQGYQGQDFEAVIDLGEVKSVTRLGAGFLQDVGSWIWLPTRVEFELSLDGVNFSKAAAVSARDVSDRDTRVSVRDLSSAFPRRDARFIRVRAFNYGAVPPWHPGAGGKAWIFVDEITVE